MSSTSATILTVSRILSLATTGLVLATSTIAIADPGDEELARRLLQESELARYANISVDLAGTFAIGSESLPIELQDRLREIDDHVSQRALEEAIAEDLAFELRTIDLQQNLAWWSGGTWRSIKSAESAFESLDIDQLIASRESFSAPAAITATPRRSELINTIVALNGYSDFFGTFNIAILEAAIGEPLEETDRQALLQQLTSSYEDNAALIYDRTADSELESYAEYLRTDAASLYLSAVRTLLIRQVESVVTDMISRREAVLDEYAQAEMSEDKQQRLIELTRNIDDGNALEATEVFLDLLRRAHPEDPEILVQLARLTLKANVTPTLFSLGIPPNVQPEALQTAVELLARADALIPNRVGTLVLRIPAKPVTDSGLRRSLIPVQAGRCDAVMELSKNTTGSSTFRFG